MRNLITLLFNVCFLGIIHAQDCQDYPRLLKEGNTLQQKKQYRPALNKYNAAKLCDPSKSIEVDKLITTVFDAIEKEKEEAVKQRDLAKKATVEAIKQRDIAKRATEEAEKQTEIAKEKTNDATALFWASESDKIAAPYGIRLLQKSLLKNSNPKAMGFIKEQMIKVFRAGCKEQFHLAQKFKDIDKYWHSEDFKWVVWIDQYPLLLNTNTNKTFDFLKGESNIKEIEFSEDGERLLVTTNDFKIKAYDTNSGKCQIFTVKNDEFGGLFGPKNSNILTIFDSTSNHRISNLFDLNNAQRVYTETNNYFSYGIELFPNKDLLCYVNINDSLARFWDIKKKKIPDFLSEFNGFKSISYSKSKRWLTTLLPDSTIRLWDLEIEKSPLFIHDEGELIDIKISDDERWLMTYNSKKTLKIWDLKKGQLLPYFKNNNSIIDGIISPDSKWVLILNNKHNFKVLDLNKSMDENPIHLDWDSTEHFKISSGWKWLIKTNKDSTKQIFNLQSKQEFDSKHFKRYVKKTFFSQNEEWIVTIDSQKRVDIWNLQTGIHYYLYSLFGIKNVDKLSFLSDANWLLSMDKQVRLWNLKTGKECSFIINLEGIKSITISNNNKLLILQYAIKTEVWDIEKEKKIDFFTQEKRINFAGFSQDDKQITFIDQHNISVWNIAGNEIDFLYKSDSIEDILELSFSYDEKFCVIDNFDSKLKVINRVLLKKKSNFTNPAIDFTLSGTITSQWSPDHKRLLTIRKRPFDNYLDAEIIDFTYSDSLVDINFINRKLSTQSSLIPIDFSPDGNWVAIRDKDSTIIVETATGLIQDILPCKGNISFSPNSKIFICNQYGNSDSYTISDSKNIYKLSTIYEYIYLSYSRFSSDSKWLITPTSFSRNYSKPELFKIINILTGEKLFLGFEDEDLIGVNFSSDSKLLLTINANKVLKVWDVESKKLLFANKNTRFNFAYFNKNNSDWIILTDEKKQQYILSIRSFEILPWLVNEKIFRLVISEDNHWLYYINENKHHKFWNIETKKELDFLKNESEFSTYGVSFSEDSNRLITKNEDDIKKVWDLPTGITPAFLKDENDIEKVLFTEDNQFVVIKSKNKLTTFNNISGEKISTLYLYQDFDNIEIINNHLLFFTVGSAIIRFDMLKKGSFFSFGDGMKTDYTHEEIQEWIKVFGDQYLLPLDEEIKKKYGIED